MSRNPYGIYKDSPRVPCPQSENLMSPSVGLSFDSIMAKSEENDQIYATKAKRQFHAILNVVGQSTFLCLIVFNFTDMEMTTWSECTKKMIDAEFERREAKNFNCFFTWNNFSLKKTDKNLEDIFKNLNWKYIRK